MKINTLSVAYTISFYGPRMLHYKFENFWNFHLGKIKTEKKTRTVTLAYEDTRPSVIASNRYIEGAYAREGTGTRL